MTHEELYGHFSNLIQTMPNLSEYRTNQADNDRWLAKAYALVEERGAAADVVEFRNAYKNFATHSVVHTRHGAEAVTAIVLRNFAALELKVAPAIQGSFIPVGSPLDAYKILVSIFATANKKVLIVDPYMDDKIITEFLNTTPEKIEIQLLSDEATSRPELKVAGDKWVKQYGDKRPLTMKLAPPRALHDRLILVDDVSVWVVSQSFKDLAKRSPASIVQSDKETAALKVAAYNQMWKDSKTI